MHERVYIHTDKDCYVAGETVWLKFYAITDHFQPSTLSKVGYVEICDTEKPRMQIKITLENGNGAGQIKIPTDVPTGMYQLTAYTRYMGNEGEKVFFHKPLAIINVGQQTSDPERMRLVESYEDIQSQANERFDKKDSDNLLIKTNQIQYNNREKVILSLDNIPDNTVDLVISVARNDSIALVPGVDKQEWLKQVKDTFLLSQDLLPEYEGHIITGNLVPKPVNNTPLLPTLAFVGKDIRYFNGQINPQTGSVKFYTSGIFDKQQIVTTITSSIYNNVPTRLDIQTPFFETLPDSLPVLSVYPNEKQLMERYIGAQIQEKAGQETIDRLVQPTEYCTFQPILNYDLDEYTRFATIDETILEFISRVRVSKVGGVRKIRVFFEEGMRFNIGNTLILLDGIPIRDHEEILQYNPMYIKKIKVYDERYFFGNEDIECIVAFETREGDLPFFRLNENSQLFDYECPQLPCSIKIPDYSINEVRHSLKPDFRHTLYWNPRVEFKKGLPVDLSFFTSDLCGEFKITVEGITSSGKLLQGVSYFQVKGNSE